MRGPNSGEYEQSAYGWALYNHPFSEASPLYRQIFSGGLDLSFTGQAEREIHYLGTILPAYRCPSDVGVTQDKTASVSPLATSNYVGNFGVGIPERQHHPAFMQGIFGENSRTRIRDIRDGTTNVVLLAERRMPRIGTYWHEGKLDGAFNSYWAGFPAGTDPLAIVGTVTSGKLPKVGSEEAQERLKNIHLADSLNQNGPLNGAAGIRPALKILRVNGNSDGQPLTGARANDVSGGYSSYHPGGLQLLLGDGSVRFVSETIDLQTYINLMRRNDAPPLISM